MIWAVIGTVGEDSGGSEGVGVRELLWIGGGGLTSTPGGVMI